jgi:hypothetical protein
MYRIDLVTSVPECGETQSPVRILHERAEADYHEEEGAGVGRLNPK